MEDEIIRELGAEDLPWLWHEWSDGRRVKVLQFGDKQEIQILENGPCHKEVWVMSEWLEDGRLVQHPWPEARAEFERLIEKARASLGVGQ